MMKGSLLKLHGVKIRLMRVDKIMTDIKVEINLKEVNEKLDKLEKRVSKINKEIEKTEDRIDKLFI